MFQFADVRSPGDDHPHTTPSPLPAPRSYNFVAASPPPNGAPPPPSTIIASRTLSVPYRQVDLPGNNKNIEHRNFYGQFTVTWSPLPVGSSVEFQINGGNGESLQYTVQNCLLPTQTTACRRVITTNTTLTADLLNCRADALIIGADDITIDLNGHRIDGTGLGFGIDLAGHEGVTIRNGTIQEFDKDLDLSGANDNYLNGLLLTGAATAGVFVSSSDATRVVGNTASGNFHGVALYDSNASEIVDNRVARNFNAGIRLFSSHGNRVERNRASGNGLSIIDGSGVGLDDSFGNRVLNNASFNNKFGILVIDSRYSPIKDNTTSGNSRAGVALIRSDGNRVELNTSLNNAGAGILLSCIEFLTSSCDAFSNGSDNNQIVNNTSFQNTEGILLRGSDDNRLTENATPNNSFGVVLRQGSLTNVVELGSAFANIQDGIRVTVDSDGATIDRNIASENGDDGIDVDNASPTTTIVGNTANDNIDLGIEADPGTTDGGGNKASGNGNPAQCTGVVCS